MLGRAEKFSQLYLIGDLPENKIKADKEALKQLEKLKSKSVNENPSVWEKKFDESLKVCYHNIHLLKDKLEDILDDPIFPFSDLLIFGETWLQPHEELDLKAVLPIYNKEDSYLKDYQVSLTNIGRGKGIAAFYKEEKFTVTTNFFDEHLQITVFKSEDLCVVGIYRSHEDKVLRMLLANVIPNSGSCLVIGDLNLCARAEPNHSVFEFLRQLGFELQIKEATHFTGGALDQAWLRTNSTVKASKTQLYSPYFNARDHDGILFSFYDPLKESGIYFLVFNLNLILVNFRS